MKLSEFDHRRIEVCLGGVAQTGVVGNCSDVAPSKLIQLGATERAGPVRTRVLTAYPDGDGGRYRRYIRQAQMCFAMTAPRSSFTIIAEDNRTRFASPTIVKSRNIVDRDAKGVLLPLNWQRHWSVLKELAENDRPFVQKNDSLIWRGVTTGRFCQKASDDVFGSRYHLARIEGLKPGIDAKFTKIVQIEACGDSFPLADVQAHMGDTMTLHAQLGSKFILCLEGNDVATGLKWALGSQSAVVMPAPRFETWLCEGELHPWEHYVPVAFDLSNLNDIYDWCLTNPKRCAEIARAGRAYVAQFVDCSKELAIIQEVVAGYLDHADVGLDFSVAERLRQFWHFQALRVDYERFKWRIRANKRGFGPV